VYRHLYRHLYRHGGNVGSGHRHFPPCDITCSPHVSCCLAFLGADSESVTHRMAGFGTGRCNTKGRLRNENSDRSLGNSQKLSFFGQKIRFTTVTQKLMHPSRLFSASRIYLFPGYGLASGFLRNLSERVHGFRILFGWRNPVVS